MSDERRRRKLATTPNVDLTDPDTVTLGEWRRLRGYPARPADDTAPSEPRALSTGHAVTPGARHTSTVDGTTVEKGEPPP